MKSYKFEVLRSRFYVLVLETPSPQLQPSRSESVDLRQVFETGTVSGDDAASLASRLH